MRRILRELMLSEHIPANVSVPSSSFYQKYEYKGTFYIRRMLLNCIKLLRISHIAIQTPLLLTVENKSGPTIFQARPAAPGEKRAICPGDTLHGRLSVPSGDRLSQVLLVMSSSVYNGISYCIHGYVYWVLSMRRTCKLRTSGTIYSRQPTSYFLIPEPCPFPVLLLLPQGSIWKHVAIQHH